MLCPAFCGRSGTVARLCSLGLLVLSLSLEFVPANSFVQSAMSGSTLFQSTCSSATTGTQNRKTRHTNALNLNMAAAKPFTRREAVQLFPGAVLLGAPGAAHADLFGSKSLNLQERLGASSVEQMPADLSSQEDIKYPAWLEGTWFVKAELTNFAAPMGTRFLGGTSDAINEKSAEEARSQIGKPVEFFLRYEQNPKGGVREDRVFNTKQRLDAFAGRQVVRRVEYVPLDRGGKTLELNTLTYFKGGLVGKTFSTRRRWETTSDGMFYCDENSRQLYGRRCEQSVESRVCPPPITTDQEVVTKLMQAGDAVKGSLRILGYLNPNDPLFFAAGQKAVTISDYQLTYSKVQPPAPPS